MIFTWQSGDASSGEGRYNRLARQQSRGADTHGEHLGHNGARTRHTERRTAAVDACKSCHVGCVIRQGVWPLTYRCPGTHASE